MTPAAWKHVTSSAWPLHAVQRKHLNHGFATIDAQLFTLSTVVIPGDQVVYWTDVLSNHRQSPSCCSSIASIQPSSNHPRWVGFIHLFNNSIGLFTVDYGKLPTRWCPPADAHPLMPTRWCPPTKFHTPLQVVYLQLLYFLQVLRITNMDTENKLHHHQPIASHMDIENK